MVDPLLQPFFREFEGAEFLECGERIWGKIPYRPCAIATASRPWSSMCRKRTVASWRDIVNLGVSNCLVANVSAQEAGSLQVNFAAEHLRQLVFHREEIQPRNVTGIEFDKHIDVAPITEVRS
jgi:hypothetical protein